MQLPDRTNRPKLEAANVVGLPSSVNWVTAGRVNPIKNQGKCGSDWAFSANAAVESAHAIFNGYLPDLSEQQLVSCSHSFGNQGCDGGWYYYAWDYAINNPITSKTTYPYTSGDVGDTDICKYVTGSGTIYSKYQTEVPGETSAIMAAIVQQPVSAAI